MGWDWEEIDLGTSQNKTREMLLLRRRSHSWMDAFKYIHDEAA